MSLGRVILNRALHMLTSSYLVPNLAVTSRLVYTNNPWGSAARGAGPPQTHYALECAVDLLAEKMGIDPLEFRRRNSLRAGRGQGDRARRHRVAVPGPVRRDRGPLRGRARARRPASPSTARSAAGVGLGAAAFGIAMPGDKSIAVVELDPDDGVTVYVAAGDPGEGNDSMLSQLVASVLDLPLAKVRLRTRSTAGHGGVRARLGQPRDLHDRRGRGRRRARTCARRWTRLGARTYAAFVAAGRPDPLPGQAHHPRDRAARPRDRPRARRSRSRSSRSRWPRWRSTSMTGEVQGGADHLGRRSGHGSSTRPNVEGQLHGGMDMGIGFALREEYVPGKTKDWITFKFPSIRHATEMETILVETPRELGTLGSVGHRRDGDGVHGARDRERDPRRLRRDGLRAARHAGAREGGARPAVPAPGARARGQRPADRPGRSHGRRRPAPARCGPSPAGRSTSTTRASSGSPDDWTEAAAEELARESGIERPRRRPLARPPVPARLLPPPTAGRPMNRDLRAGTELTPRGARAAVPGRDQDGRAAAGRAAEPQDVPGLAGWGPGRDRAHRLPGQRRDHLPEGARRAARDGRDLRPHRGVAGARQPRPRRAGGRPASTRRGPGSPASSAPPTRTGSPSAPTPPTRSTRRSWASSAPATTS